MRFPPIPENDFAQYIDTYWRECRARCDAIEAIAGKWMFRDLLPGMSDFDTRFIVSDDTTVADWRRMSMAVGEAHLSLCRKFPAWSRNLEHLPGVNLTWSELAGEATYYPEYQQWSFYATTQPARLSAALDTLGRRAWDAKDEYFHLKKFCLYFGRYNRTIDPAINLGAHAVKYPLHSRLMHYFAPPMLSAVCLLDRRHFVGKFEALERAEAVWPDLRCWPAVNEILHAHYETPRWYAEPHVTQLEDMLEEALRAMAASLAGTLTLVPADAGADVAAWKRALADAPMDPALIIFDNAKFSRLMKGRLHFYANAPAHFDSLWLIQNELGRLGQSFFVAPFRAYWQVRTGERVEDPTTILDALRGDPLTDEEIRCTREFARLMPGRWTPGTEREIALAAVDVFDEFFGALNKISDAVANAERGMRNAE